VSNPGGAGDSASASVLITPFRTTPPDFTDSVPMVRLQPAYAYGETGNKLLVTWAASDDGSVSSQRVLFAGATGAPFVVLADNLAGWVRSAEISLPLIPPSNLNEDSIIRVEAIDDAGQRGWDEEQIFVPYLGDWNATVTPVNPPTGTLTPGQRFTICWTKSGPSAPFGLVDVDVYYDDLDLVLPLGGSTTDCLPLGFPVPYVSSDLVRLGYRITVGAGKRDRIFFTDYFTVRPDVRIGDAPPQVSLLTPLAGQSFAGGSVVPMTWVASDDEGLRSFSIQVSLNGGLSWQAVADLPGTATSFGWRIPTSTGAADCRVRVIARDQRFQTTSDGTNRSLVITPGLETGPGDINGDGLATLDDVLPFVQVLLGEPQAPAHVSRADLTSDGASDGADVQPFVMTLVGP
jgi:hypothetical protein